mmetsp:Transcript_16483/g.45438  ORF Transcript_16483/g.45438 Transcript_16483/m.45438 type:complete len:220 (+) Transcript_16483:180-839(+)
MMACSVLSRRRRRNRFSTTRSVMALYYFYYVALATIATGLFSAGTSSSFTILYSFPNSSLWREIYGGGHGQGQRQRQRRQQDYYHVLGIDQNASRDDVKTAFRRLVKRFHPDANLNTDTTQQFQAINKAYETLSDPTKRRQYNAQMYHSGYSPDTPNFVIDAFEGGFEPVPRKCTSNTPAELYRTIPLQPNENFNGSLLQNDNDEMRGGMWGGNTIRCY